MAPGLGLLLGAVVLPFLPAFLRRAWVPALGVLTLLGVAGLSAGDRQSVHFWGASLELLAVDAHRLLVGGAFTLLVVAWGVFTWDEEGRAEKAAGLLYGGAALLVVFAGDWLTLLLGWETMALASTGLLLAGRRPGAPDAAFRYFVFHLLAGVLVLAGVALVHTAQHAWTIEPLALAGLGPVLLFLGFALGAAAWPVSAWAADAWPRASAGGGALLAVLTPVLAAFVLARVFPSTPALLVLGGLMAIYGMVYALFTRNLRRLASYVVVGHVGAVLAAAGASDAAAGAMGRSAATAQAFAVALGGGLLFLALGGLRRRMPWTFGAAVVAVASLSAVPLTAGFAAWRAVMETLARPEGQAGAFARGALLVFAAAAPLFLGLRVLWLASSGRAEEAEADAPATLPMRLAMGGLALAVVLLGLAPGLWLRRLLPADAAFGPFRAAGLGLHLALLAAGTLAFVVWRLLAARALFAPPRALPDVDRLWRAGARGFVAFVEGPFARAMDAASTAFHVRVPEQLAWIAQNPAGFFRVAFERIRLGVTALFGSARMIDRAQARFAQQLDVYRRTRSASAWPIGRTVFYISLLLALALVVWLVR